jgi:hypothetical protein
MPDPRPPQAPDPPLPDQHGEDLLDEALEETFPASDPISPRRSHEPGDPDPPRR